MKRLLAIILLTSLAAFAKDHSADYKMGIFISAEAVADGTVTVLPLTNQTTDL